MMLKLVGLERTTKAGVQDRIDHSRGSHDDVANAAAGALVFAYEEVGYSPGQRLKDNMKIQAAYKKWAKAIA